MEATLRLFCSTAQHSPGHVWLSVVAFVEGQVPASWVSGGRARVFLFVVGGVPLAGQVALELTLEVVAPQSLAAARLAFSWSISSGRCCSESPFPHCAEAAAPAGAVLQRSRFAGSPGLDSCLL